MFHFPSTTYNSAFPYISQFSPWSSGIVVRFASWTCRKPLDGKDHEKTFKKNTSNKPWTIPPTGPNKNAFTVITRSSPYRWVDPHPRCARHSLGEGLVGLQGESLCWSSQWSVKLQQHLGMGTLYAATLGQSPGVERVCVCVYTVCNIYIYTYINGFGIRNLPHARRKMRHKLLTCRWYGYGLEQL